MAGPAFCKRSILVLMTALLAVFAANAACAAHRPDEILVTYKPGLRPQAMTSIAAVGGQVVGHISQIRTKTVRLPKGVTVEDAIKRFRDDPNVEYAGPNHIVSICRMPNDEWFLDPYIYYYWQWGLFSDAIPNAGIDAPRAWDITTGSADIVIAILDTGVDLTHEDLYAKIVPGRNVITGAPNPNNPDDDHGHGTFTAGVAAAMTNNFTGVAGVSWGARIMPIKALDYSGYGTEADAAAGIIWAADNGAHVINMSMGGYDDVPVEQQAVQYAWSKGCILVGASGNDDSSALFFPASYEEVLAVGASNEARARCTSADWFEGGSNYGNYLDVMAPGNNIMSTWTDYSGGTYTIASGTSAAAPFAAGTAALLLSHYPSWTNAQVVNQIKMTARDMGAKGWDQYTGWGLVNAYYALTQPPMPSRTLGELRALQDGTLVKIANAVISSGSADLPDRMYIQQADRACGIMLPFSTPPAGYQPGDLVEAVGTLGTADGERALQGVSLTRVSSGTQPSPLGVRSQSIGGSQTGHTPGPTGSKGPNNVGLLVTVYGRVTAPPGWTYFYIDDGSGLSDGSGFAGLKVLYSGSSKPASGSYVRVTGISSIERPVPSVSIPVIRVRKPADITPLP